MYALLGWEPFLRCPPVDNARNLIDFGLYTHFWKVSVPSTIPLLIPCRISICIHGHNAL
jgi:hypothetical protein